MLLPQSSAFAALKNRLNSVSAIGYLHIAPRPYVFHSRNNSVVETISQFQSFEHRKSIEAYPSLSSTVTSQNSSSGYDRSTRLKGREDSGIKWGDLLEKFRSVQERARRAQRPGGESEGGLNDARGADPLDARSFKDLVPLPGPAVPIKDQVVVAQPPAHKSKSSLGKFGRLGGAVASARGKR